MSYADNRFDAQSDGFPGVGFVGTSLEQTDTETLLGGNRPQTRSETRTESFSQRYRLLDVQGRGSMGVVHKARQLSLDRTVAVKIMNEGTQADLHRFQTEAEAISRLHHPNIVQVFEAGEWNGRRFFSMEFVAETLADKLNGTPFDPFQAARLVGTLAHAIHHAHVRGIVHRDLKPANVLLNGKRDAAIDQYTPKIADFGLAKYLNDDCGQTKTGLVLGTPAYMSPEQAKGDTESVGPHSDVYALGAILFEMLTGKPPIHGTTVLEILDKVRNEEPMAPRRLNPSVPHNLEVICRKCLEKDPQRRYESALALAQDVNRFLRGEPINARPTTWVSRCLFWCRRPERIRDAGIVTVFLAVVVFLEHCIVGSLIGLDTGLFQTTTRVGAIFDLLFAMAIFDVPLAIVGLYTIRRRPVAIFGGLIMHLFSLAWLVGGLVGAEFVLQTIDSAGVFRTWESRLPLFLFPTVVTVIAVFASAAALSAYFSRRDSIRS